MQQLNDIVDSKILKQYNTQEKRSYLGASSIGDECIRKVQLQYMQKDQKVSAKQIRTFDIGHCLEDLVIKWLRIAGFDLKTRNENGEQFGFSVANGKFAGHVDGLIYNFPEEFPDKPEGPALLEIKTMNHKSWNDTQKRGVLVSKPVYYSQVQLYMAYLELDRCLFVALNKDTSDLYFEIIPFDPGMAQKYSDRAVQIIKATENNELLPCVSGDSSFFLCKMCGFRDHCWKEP
ncbi:MAG: hypothetical protein J6T91_00495 [Alphaproteobacteria bacterium]|nr:hypothetical protein [Alphaproteobacteria bacterium]